MATISGDLMKALLVLEGTPVVTAQLEHREICCAMWLASSICLLAEICFLTECIVFQNAKVHTRLSCKQPEMERTEEKQSKW